MPLLADVEGWLGDAELPADISGMGTNSACQRA